MCLVTLERLTKLNKIIFIVILSCIPPAWGFPSGSAVENLPAMQDAWVPSFGWEDPQEKEITTQSSILAWEILWSVGLQSMGSQRVGHNLATKHTHHPLEFLMPRSLWLETYEWHLKDAKMVMVVVFNRKVSNQADGGQRQNRNWPTARSHDFLSSSEGVHLNLVTHPS